MFSPHDSPAVNDWFRRLDAAWRHLPAEERASQREEIQQHLEGLVAANITLGQLPDDAWKAALKQFGDPTRIGRKMYQEWQQGRVGFRADMKAILFGVSLGLVSWFVQGLLWNFWFARLYSEHDSLYTHGHGLVGLALVVSRVVGYGGAALISVTIGRKYPFQAIKSTFYADVLWSLWVCGAITVSISGHTNRVTHSDWSVLAYILLWTPLWKVGSVAVAYLASVTKRGWYRPSWADFKLTLPRRRLHLSR